MYNLTIMEINDMIGPSARDVRIHIQGTFPNTKLTTVTLPVGDYVIRDIWDWCMSQFGRHNFDMTVIYDVDMDVTSDIITVYFLHENDATLCRLTWTITE